MLTFWFNGLRKLASFTLDSPFIFECLNSSEVIQVPVLFHFLEYQIFSCCYFMFCMDLFIFRRSSYCVQLSYRVSSHWICPLPYAVFVVTAEHCHNHHGLFHQIIWCFCQCKLIIDVHFMERIICYGRVLQAEFVGFLSSRSTCMWIKI
jgi:hypothetical protein